MANFEHVEIVKQGAEAILRWRLENSPATQLDLIGADLSHLQLKGALLDQARLDGANLTQANLTNASLISASLTNAHLLDTDLTGANLGIAVLTYANLMAADLTDAILVDADLSFVDLNKANLSRADMSRSMLCGTNLNGACLEGAIMSDCCCVGTVFAAVDLSTVRGLESAEHAGPSTIGVDTIFLSKGKISELFLEGAGVPDEMIAAVRSLAGAALEFHACFISCSEADDVFNTRLYDDLKDAGVRCWRWKEDARWGSTLMAEIDRAIRVYDKVVVILSKASLESEPVIREIERALQREQREKKDVLFPIRVDDAIFSWQHALQADVVRKFIGDFQEWQTPERYEAAMERLMRDLRTEDTA